MITNFCKCSGIVTNIKKCSYDKSKKELTLKIKKNEDEYDNITIRIDNKLLSFEYKINDIVCITGEIHTYNEFKDHKNNMIIYVLASSVEKVENKHFNVVELNGCSIYTIKKTIDGNFNVILMYPRKVEKKTDYFECIFDKKYESNILCKNNESLNVKAEICQINNDLHKLIILDIL